MIVVRLIGGLGNQLFQYAFGRALAVRYGRPLTLDCQFLTSPSRPYGLDVFNIKAEVDVKSHLTRRFLNALGTVYSGRYITSEKAFGVFDPTVFNLAQPRYFRGYWQSSLYFEEVRDLLLSEIVLKETYTSETYIRHVEEIEACNAVSLHVRRGDYLTSAAARFHGSLPTEYYVAAVHCLERQSMGKFRLFIFSDDIDWCKENLQSLHDDIVFMPTGLRNYEDLLLMSKCKSNIIANSSFSWWGAWLNTNPEKIVIRPNKWFHAKDVSSKDVCPANWISL